MNNEAKILEIFEQIQTDISEIRSDVTALKSGVRQVIRTQDLTVKLLTSLEERLSDVEKPLHSL